MDKSTYKSTNNLSGNSKTAFGSFTDFILYIFIFLYRIMNFFINGINYLGKELKNFANNMDCTLNDIFGNPTFKNIFLVLIVLFILVMIGLHANISDKKSALLLITAFLITIFSLSLFFSFSSTYRTIIYNKKLLFLIIFICILIYLFTELSNSELKKNASYLYPFILLIGGALLYFNIFHTIDYKDLVTKFYNNSAFLENKKISSIIIYICLCVFLFLLYNSKIGNYAMKSYNDLFGTNLKINTGKIITFIILILVLGFIFLVYNLLDPAQIPDGLKNFLKRSTMIYSIGFIIFLSILIWIITTLASYSNTGSGFVNFIINAFFIVIILGIMFRLLTSSDFYNKSPALRLIVNSIFYIPCLFYPLIEGMYSLFFKLFTGIKSQDELTKNNLILLIIVIIMYLVYFVFYPYLIYSQQTQDGMLLVNNPISIRNKTTLASYQTLHGKEDFDYQYGVSFWLYLDSENPSINLASNKYTSVINYGDKFNLEYNVRLNTMRLTVLKNGIQPTDKANKSYDELYDVIFEKKDIPLQKWNNIMINYTGGTLDIFYNGSMINSNIKIVPYMEYDTLDVGTEKGIFGRVCNVNYFKEPLTTSQIYYLYNSVKDKTPPIVSEMNKTVMNISEYTIKPISSFNVSDPDYDSNLPDDSELPDNDIPDKKLDPKDISNFNPDYLSLKWYFTANKDNQNV